MHPFNKSTHLSVIITLVSRLCQAGTLHSLIRSLALCEAYIHHSSVIKRRLGLCDNHSNIFPLFLTACRQVPIYVPGYKVPNRMNGYGGYTSECDILMNRYGDLFSTPQVYSVPLITWLELEPQNS